MFKKIITSFLLSVILVFLLINDNPFRRRVKISINSKTPIEIVINYNNNLNKNFNLLKKIKQNKNIYLPKKVKNLKIELANNKYKKDLNNLNIKIENKKIKLLQNENNNIIYENNKIIRGSRHIEKYILTCITIILLSIFFFYCDKFEFKEREGKILANVNFLRLFFAFVVSLEHIPFYLKTDFLIIKSCIPYAECFIIISGFILYLTSKFDKVEFKDYFKKRVIRLFPSYFFVLVIIFPFLSDICCQTLNTNLLINVKYFVITRLSSLFLVLEDSKYGIGILWAIPFFFWANCLLFCILKYCKEKAGFIISLCFFIFLHLYFANNISILTINRYNLMLACLFGGYFVAIISKNFQLTNNKQIVNFFEIYVFSFIIIFLFKNMLKDVPHFAVIYYIYTAVIIYLFTQKKGLISNLFENKIFTFLSRYTFAYYLIHEIVFLAFTKYNILLNINPKIRLSIAIFSAMIASVLLYHLVEKPIADKFKKKALN